MPWISQIVLIGLIRIESNIETHVVIGIHKVPSIVAMNPAEVGFHPRNRGQIPIAIGDQFRSILGILKLEEHDVVDSGRAGRGTSGRQDDNHDSSQNPDGAGVVHGGEYSQPVSTRTQDQFSQAVVTVQSRCSDRDEEAFLLASRLGVPHVKKSDGIPDHELRIVLLEDRMELWDRFSRRKGMRVDFRGIDRRVGNGSLSHKQPLARSIGKNARSIVDATAGLGHDAFLLACMGWNVHAIERHPVIHALLEESHRDAISDPGLSEAIEDRLVVEAGEAENILERLESDPPDVVYLDPMFQDVQGSALPRKPAQILRRIVPPDGPSVEQRLFEVSRRIARQRVVVKRSDKASPLAEGVDMSHQGKIVRYDVYLTGRASS